MSGLGVKGIQAAETKKEILNGVFDIANESGITIEHILAWFLAGFLGALGALVLNLTHKAIVNKLNGKRDAKKGA